MTTSTTADASAPALASLTDWVGRTETTQDDLAGAAMAGLSATLDRDDPAPVAGTILPPLWHWIYFLPRARQSEIGPDGHPRRGGFLPPVPLPRRMWAGGRLTWHAPMRIGDAVTRVSRIDAVTHKSGRSGDLLFVKVGHEFSTPAGLALREEHDIVYRPAPHPADAPPAPVAAPANFAWSRRIVPDDVLLFRYSALTFNGHRIHYDRRYVTEVEGYPGLIVHGPLIATLLVDLLRRNLPDAQLKHFAFRAIKPLFDIAPFDVCGQPSADGKTVELWARDAEGWLTMQATATLA